MATKTYLGNKTGQVGLHVAPNVTETRFESQIVPVQKPVQFPLHAHISKLGHI